MRRHFPKSIDSIEKLQIGNKYKEIVCGTLSKDELILVRIGRTLGFTFLDSNSFPLASSENNIYEIYPEDVSVIPYNSDNEDVWNNYNYLLPYDEPITEEMAQILHRIKIRHKASIENDWQEEF